MATGNRDYSIIGDSVLLGAMVYRKSDSGMILYNAYNVSKVEIYPSLIDATNNTNIIETITTINNPSTGVYNYETQIMTIPKTYFDKIYFTMVSGGLEQSYIQEFYVYSTDFIIVGEVPKKRIVYGYVDKIFLEPDIDLEITITLSRSSQYVDGSTKVDVIKNTGIVLTDNTGFWSTQLDVTDFMETDVYYKITVVDYVYTVKIPYDVTALNIIDAPIYIVE